jgi:hypothetical protein
MTEVTYRIAQKRVEDPVRRLEGRANKHLSTLNLLKHFLENDRIAVRVFYTEKLESVGRYFRRSAVTPRPVSS